MKPAKKLTLVISVSYVPSRGGMGWGLLVDIRSADGNVSSDGASEADDVDEDAGDISDVGAEVDAVGVVVGSGLERRV